MLGFEYGANKVGITRQNAGGVTLREHSGQLVAKLNLIVVRPVEPGTGMKDGNDSQSMTVNVRVPPPKRVQPEVH